MRRREFIILSGVGATSAGVLSACGHPEEKVIPVLVPDNEYVPGVDNWKASTCQLCPGGCGIVVRTRDHKASKIEGNPLHPVNRGALCARGQAGLEVLYNPDRIKGPMKRIGERGEGKWEEISWDEAIKTLADTLRETDSREQALFVTTQAKGVTAHVANRLMESIGQGMFVVWPLFNHVETEASYWHSYGSASFFDLANSTFLISFGARFLETWHSPVMYSQAYGEFRNSAGKPRGKFVHVEPRMSLTAADADEWLPAAAGTEGLLALAIAQVIVREALNKVRLFANALEEFSPELTSSLTDVPADRVVRLAREFAKAERPLAIGSLSSDSMTAVNLLNTLVGNLNKRGGVLVPERHGDYYGPLRMLAPIDRFLELSHAEFPNARRMKPLRVMMVHNFNPVLITQDSSDVTSVGFIASFSSFMDETTELADLLLPDHSYLESWDIQASYPTTGGMTVSLNQPVIEPQFDTRQTADVLLALARGLGGESSRLLPFESAKEIIERAAADFAAYSAGSPSASNDSAAERERVWSELTERGLASAAAEFKPKSDESAKATLIADLVKSFQNLKSKQSTDHDNQLTLIIYEQPTIGDSAGANLPSLQELPDPMTSVMWGSWVEINPRTAASLGISDGDLVEVANEGGSVRLPALLFPAIRPDVVAIPLGQGHSSYGRYARGRGSNPATLLPRAHRGPALEATTRAKLTRVAGKGELIRFGTQLMEHMESKR